LGIEVLGVRPGIVIIRIIRKAILTRVKTTWRGSGIRRSSTWITARLLRSPGITARLLRITARLLRRSGITAIWLRRRWSSGIAARLLRRSPWITAIWLRRRSAKVTATGLGERRSRLTGIHVEKWQFESEPIIQRWMMVRNRGIKTSPSAGGAFETKDCQRRQTYHGSLRGKETYHAEMFSKISESLL
jgi:hypothetical protein